MILNTWQIIYQNSPNYIIFWPIGIDKDDVTISLSILRIKVKIPRIVTY